MEIVQMPDQQFIIVEKDRNILFLIKNPTDQTLMFEDLNKSKNFLLRSDSGRGLLGFKQTTEARYVEKKEENCLPEDIGLAAVIFDSDEFDYTALSSV